MWGVCLLPRPEGTQRVSARLVEVACAPVGEEWGWGAKGAGVRFQALGHVGRLRVQPY
jgi:hypothetical protein